MLKYFNFSKKSSIKKLEYILKSRKQSQDIRTESVKKILLNVRKNGDNDSYKKDMYQKEWEHCLRNVTCLPANEIEAKVKKTCL